MPSGSDLPDPEGVTVTVPDSADEPVVVLSCAWRTVPARRSRPRDRAAGVQQQLGPARRLRHPRDARSDRPEVGPEPAMVTSFTDAPGSPSRRRSLAKTTGMTVSRRGMVGADHAGHVDDLVAGHDVAELRRLGGWSTASSVPGRTGRLRARLDRGLGAVPLPRAGQLGTGPLQSLYTASYPRHSQVPSSLAGRAVRQRRQRRCRAAPVEVVTTAEQDLLPVGVAEGCRLLRDVARD